MFAKVLRLEGDKLFSRWLLWIGLIIIIVPMMIFFLLMFYPFRGTFPLELLTWPGGLIVSLNFATGYLAFTSYGIFLLVFVVGMVMAQEYSWRTMQLWLSHGLSRPLLLIAKFAVAVVVVILIVSACLLVGGVTTMIFGYQLHGSVDINQVDFGQLFLSYLRTAYGMLPYVALSFLLAVISRSVAVTVGGALVLVMGVQAPLSLLLPLLGENYARISYYLPTGLSQALSNQNYALAKMAIPAVISGQPSPTVAAICIALYTLVLFGISLWIFQKQDLTN